MTLFLGVDATDDMEGNLTSKVSMIHQPARVTTEAPTPEDEPFAILYTVRDSAGNEADLIARLIHVVCPAGQELCPPLEGEDPDNEKLVCSSDPKLCKFAQLGVSAPPEEPPEEAAAETASPPEIQLVGPSEVTLTAGENYKRCSVSTPLSVVCDRGAMAYDQVDGDLTRAIQVR